MDLIANGEPHRGHKHFSSFKKFPFELRMRVWKLNLTPRIIRWQCKDNKNVFTTTENSTSLLYTCRESRLAAFLYGKYELLQPDPESRPLYISPQLDWLKFDPTWYESSASLEPEQEKRRKSMNTVLFPTFNKIQNIMTQPNWVGEAAKPLICFRALPAVKNVLVVADESALSLQFQIFLNSMSDIKSYYRRYDGEVPYIAVGCLGWAGKDRWKLQRPEQDSRELTDICENDAQMKAKIDDLQLERRNLTHKLANDLAQNLNLGRAVSGSQRPQPASLEMVRPPGCAGVIEEEMQASPGDRSRFGFKDLTKWLSTQHGLSAKAY